jgi:hypothetical protein
MTTIRVSLYQPALQGIVISLPIATEAWQYPGEGSEPYGPYAAPIVWRVLLNPPIMALAIFTNYRNSIVEIQ